MDKQIIKKEIKIVNNLAQLIRNRRKIPRDLKQRFNSIHCVKCPLTGYCVVVSTEQRIVLIFKYLLDSEFEPIKTPICIFLLSCPHTVRMYNIVFK